ncbi:lipid A ethanolaminephosphotransferase [Pseudacidovorax intermedius]|uniref:Lipid A ethanolaminephosphotransferase n=1 Tax=Pseudacidovorax intermedius TaxID=433924 RepID=A0A370F7D3_9BURK|nr:phosphoethanolamine--lipid A transferase [Pseudacidovorax intermedius]RDI19153.1 lipid A ethanolaminephosphotransferase [Pseudacidovorax intermedius]
MPLISPAPRLGAYSVPDFAGPRGWLLRARSPRTIVLVLTAYLLLAANWPLWMELAELGRAPSLYMPNIVGMAWLLGGGLVALLSLTAWSRFMKPLWMLLVVVAAVVQHYMATYRMVMDPSMALNVLQTDPGEARDLLSLTMALRVLAVAVPAIWWLWCVPVIPQRPLRALWRNAVLFVAAVATTVGGGMLMSRQLAPLMRNQPHLRYMMNPLASVYSFGMAATRPLLHRSRKLVPISGGAALGASYAGQSRPRLLLLVVGETARADHFGINGYARDTTPELKARKVVSFHDMRSCGTNTAASVPCMFSHLGKQGYEGRKQDYENLLDVVQGAGLAVLWIDNQSGCKGVCERVPHVEANDAKEIAANPTLCSGDECLDDVMLKGLDARIAALPPERVARGVVLVMHQIGSHGPAYFRRSPPDGKPFQPECRTVTLSDCAHSELINAYDNSIAHTDRFLGEAIDWLQARRSRFDTGMLYLSDHGESLGEYGLFLHGVPYAFAPDVQKHVPFVAWLDGGLGGRTGVQDACLRKSVDMPLTHDNLYHTVMGLVDVKSPTYKPALDAFEGCRQASAG